MSDMSVEERIVAEALHGWLDHSDDELWETRKERERDAAADVIAVLDLPARDAAVRADERAKVRAELLAIAAMFDPHEVTGHGGKPVHYLFIHAADRIAPE